MVSIFRAIGRGLLDIISKLLKGFDKLPFEIFDFKFTKTKTAPKPFQLAIILIESLQPLKNLFSLFVPENLNSKDFITIVTSKTLEIDKLNQIFEMAWQASVTNVSLVMTTINGSTELFTFMPFNGFKCGDTTPVKIDSFDIDCITWKTKKIHPKSVGNLQKCPVVVAASASSAEPCAIGRFDSEGNHEIFGIERDIFEELAKIFNFNLKI